MDKHFEDMMRKKVEADRLKTEQESIEFWHAKLTAIKHEQTLEAQQAKLNEILRTMENRIGLLDRERKQME